MKKIILLLSVVSLAFSCSSDDDGNESVIDCVICDISGSDRIVCDNGDGTVTQEQDGESIIIDLPDGMTFEEFSVCPDESVEECVTCESMGSDVITCDNGDGTVTRGSEVIDLPEGVTFEEFSVCPDESVEECVTCESMESDVVTCNNGDGTVTVKQEGEQSEIIDLEGVSFEEFNACPIEVVKECVTCESMGLDVVTCDNGDGTVTREFDGESEVIVLPAGMTFEEFSTCPDVNNSELIGTWGLVFGSLNGVPIEYDECELMDTLTFTSDTFTNVFFVSAEGECKQDREQVSVYTTNEGILTIMDDNGEALSLDYSVFDSTLIINNANEVGLASDEFFIIGYTKIN